MLRIEKKKSVLPLLRLALHVNPMKAGNDFFEPFVADEDNSVRVGLGYFVNLHARFILADGDVILSGEYQFGFHGHKKPSTLPALWTPPMTARWAELKD